MKCLVSLLSAALLLQVISGDNNLQVSQSANAFASQLYEVLASTPGNILVCPFSVHIVLSLVDQGAVGATKEELNTALRLSDSENVKSDYRTLLSGLQDDVLKIATKLYPATSFTLKPNYVSLAQYDFFSDVQNLDYNYPAAAANTINQFVADKTNNKIQNIIDPGSLSALTRLVIVNAVYFKAEWAKPFPPAIPLNFKVSSTESIQTDFLAMTDSFPYKEDSALGAKILKLNYKGGNYSMVFVLPDKDDGLGDVEAKLANISMDTLLSGMTTVRVEVTIPKFKIEQNIQLNDPLMKLGITRIFDSRANLSNIAVGENLYVSAVVQKTFIDVNENGTEAAAATAVVIATLSVVNYDPPKVFKADHPFVLYLIKDDPVLTLFSGRLANPQGGVNTTVSPSGC